MTVKKESSESKNKSQKSKEDLHNRTLQESERIAEIFRKRGIRSTDTTAEYAGQTSLFFSIGHSPDEPEIDSDFQLTPEEELEHIKELCEKYGLWYQEPPELFELLALPLSERVKAVTADIESKTDKYRVINAFVLGVLFDVPFENLCENHVYMAGDWDNYFCVPKITFSEYADNYYNEGEKLKALDMTIDEQEAVLLDYAQGEAESGDVSTFHVYGGPKLNLMFGFGRFCDMSGSEWRSAQSPYDYRDNGFDELDENDYWALAIGSFL